MQGHQDGEISLRVGHHLTGDSWHPVQVERVPMTLRMAVAVAWSSAVD
jgi:hypothetical protein